jgi:hypothetical protein
MQQCYLKNKIIFFIYRFKLNIQFNSIFRFALKLLDNLIFDNEIDNHELNNLKKLDHANIIKYQDHLVFSNRIGLITQYYKVNIFIFFDLILLTLFH